MKIQPVSCSFRSIPSPDQAPLGRGAFWSVGSSAAAAGCEGSCVGEGQLWPLKRNLGQTK